MRADGRAMAAFHCKSHGRFRLCASDEHEARCMTSATALSTAAPRFNSMRTCSISRFPQASASRRYTGPTTLSINIKIGICQKRCKR